MLLAVILVGCDQRNTPEMVRGSTAVVRATPKPTAAASLTPTAGVVAREVRAAQVVAEATPARIVAVPSVLASPQLEPTDTRRPARPPSATPTALLMATSDVGQESLPGLPSYTATPDPGKEHLYQLPVTGEDWDCYPVQEPSVGPAVAVRITAEAALICLYGFAPGDRVALALYGPRGALQGSGLAIVWPDEEVARTGLPLTLPGSERVGRWHLVARVDDVEVVHEFDVAETGPICGQILCEDQSLAGVQVALHSAGSAGQVTLGSAVTDPEGRFALPGAPLGSLELHMSAPANDETVRLLVWPFDLLTDLGTDLGRIDLCAPTGVPPARRIP
jgi:hypothetical protein